MHSWRGERDPSVSVWSGQGPRLSPLSPPASSFPLPFLPPVLPCFQHSLSSLSVTSWHVHPSVCPVSSRRWPFPGFSQMQIYKHRWKCGRQKKEKKKKEKKGPWRHTHLKDTCEKYCTDDVFIQFLIRKPQKCPASFARLRASPMSDTSLVGAPTTLQVLKQNNHCAIPNKRPQKQ